MEKGLESRKGFFSKNKKETEALYNESSFIRQFKRNRVLLLMLMPAVAYFLLFSYFPMTGSIVAFKNYNFRDGIFGSPWVGFDNFEYFFLSGQAWTVTRNTILYNIAFIVINTILQMGLAILISEIGGKFFKKVTQTAMFLPYFISWVVVGMIAYNFLNVEHGTINTLIAKLGMAIYINILLCLEKCWIWYSIIFGSNNGNRYRNI